jgi:cytochrome b involved in lipid metabolism
LLQILVRMTIQVSKIGQVLSHYTSEDVRSHNSESDGWIIMNGGVYDVSKFVKMHPGGKDILLPYLGLDITEIFVSSQIHPHSQKAFRLLEKYCVGFTDSVQSTKRAEVDALSSLVDMDKPVLPQVLEMDVLKYQSWVHQATGTPKMRIFSSQFLESLSRWPWWYIFPMVHVFLRFF